VTYSVAERRSNELFSLHVETSTKPEDNLCPMMISFFPDTSLINELFPAPVIPMTAITMPDELGLILADHRLAERRDAGRLEKSNDCICLFGFEKLRD
jgi:hypothetical protein